MAKYFELPNHVAAHIKELYDKYKINELNRKLSLKAKAEDIVNKKYGYHEGEAIDYDTVIGMIVDALESQEE